MLTLAPSTIWRASYDDKLVIHKESYKSSKKIFLFNLILLVIDLIVFLLTMYHNDNHIISTICLISCVLLHALSIALLVNTILFLEKKSDLASLIKHKHFYSLLDKLNPNPLDIMLQSDKTKQITIEVLSGYEIDKTNSTFECIVFKAIEPVLPTRWEDIKCVSGYFVNAQADIAPASNVIAESYNRSIWPTRELAEASIALAQLCQLRDVYNDGWVADWRNNIFNKFIIKVVEDLFTVNNFASTNCILAFKSTELRDQFFTNFKDLLEIAKPLL